MALRVTVDIFSGRPNPVVELTADEARDFLSRIKPAQAVDREKEAPVPDSVLGYRGLLIEQTGTLARGLPARFRLADGVITGPRLFHRVTDPKVEDDFCGTRGPLGRLPLGEEFPRRLPEELKRFRDLRVRFPKIPPFWPRPIVCRCAPLYEPAWWNDAGPKQWGNNCYNYGCNYRTDTFAQPGRANGAMYSALSCASVLPAAVADALIDSPTADNKCPREGHLVALVIAPGWDFHWYRKGRNGRWTHKPGSTAVTNLDNSGLVIPDPRTADRGPYTDFCTFMVVMHGHVKIN